MLNIQTFDRANLKDLRVRIDKALSDHVFVTGVKFELGTMRFDANTCSAKLTMTTSGAAKEESARALASLTAAMERHRIASVNGKNGEQLIDYHYRKPTYPFIVVKRGGRKVKMTVVEAQRVFGFISKPGDDDPDHGSHSFGRNK